MWNTAPPAACDGEKILVREPGGLTELLARLEDGQWHAGPELARRLGVSRAAIWKRVAALRKLGLAVERDHDRGYRLGTPLRGLSLTEIRDGLETPPGWENLKMELWPVTDSTNERLLRQTDHSSPRVGLAEYQTRGRGRRGRSWQGAFGASLLISFGIPFPIAPPDLQSLGLISGIVACRAIGRAGYPTPGLKWPNDLWYGSGKFGGILVELSGEAEGPLWCVIGYGLNITHAAELPGAMSLESVAPDRTCNRNRLAGYLIEEEARAIQIFKEEGFGPFMEEYAQHDILYNRPVQVLEGHPVHRERNGWARGVRADGALWFEAAPGHREALVAGEVSLRLQRSP